MIKNGKIVHKAWFSRVDEFDIVDKFPDGYIVWCIGRDNFPYKGYIPLAKPTDIPYNIDLKTLNALKMDERLADDILSLAHRQEVNSLNFEDIILSMSSKYNL